MRFGKLLLPLIAFAGLTGCINIDYVGQTYDQDPYRQVRWYNTGDTVPADTYRVAGRATASCGSDRTNDDVRYALMEEAAKRGVDAIQVVKVDLKTVKKTTVNDTGFGQFGSNQRDPMRDGVWTPYDSFGKPTSRSVREVETQRFEAKVLFLVYKERYAEALRQFQEERRPTIETTPLVPAKPGPLAPLIGEDPADFTPAKETDVVVSAPPETSATPVDPDLPLDPENPADALRPVETVKDL